MSKLALRAQTVDIADLSLRQDLLAKNVLMTAQRNFCLGNGPLIVDDEGPVRQMLKHLGEMRGWACMLAARVNPSRHSNSGFKRISRRAATAKQETYYWPRTLCPVIKSEKQLNLFSYQFSCFKKQTQ